MLVITKEHKKKAARLILEKRIKLMAASLREDFPDNLKQIPQETIEKKVSASVNRMMGYGFSNGGRLYELAAWELFYGKDYEAKLGDGSLLKICQDTSLGESVKFDHFVQRLSSPEFETRSPNNDRK